MSFLVRYVTRTSYHRGRFSGTILSKNYFPNPYGIAPFSEAPKPKHANRNTPYDHHAFEGVFVNKSLPKNS
tara:strand:- start:135 stop:347 length:213 start_codon:yes stop_codon:yes gene_type:complete